MATPRDASKTMTNKKEMSFVTGPSLRKVDLGGKAKSWRWLGAMKTQLSYDDDSSSDSEDEAAANAKATKEVNKFSKEDEEALDRVFKNEGTAKTAERMRTALNALAADLTALRASLVVDEDTVAPPVPPPEHMSESLLTVRDIVRDRSDFARAFVALGGLDVLLGCVSERTALSRKVRSSCFDLLAVLAGGNVPIQLRLLDENAVRTLATLYFAEFPEAASVGAHAGALDGGATHLGADAREGDDEGLLRSQIVRAIDKSVLGHAGAELKFCKSSRGRRVIEAGLGHTPAVSTRNLMGGGAAPPPAVLKRRCLSLLEDLLTSRFADGHRFEAFGPAMTHASLRLTLPEDEDDKRVREAALETIVHVLRAERKKGVSDGPARSMKKELESLGEGRIEELRGGGAAADAGEAEKDLWVAVLAELERA